MDKKIRIRCQTRDHDEATKLAYLGEGEWVEEFDMTEWEYRGYSGYIQRKFSMGFGGHLFGYVFIPKENKLCNVEDLGLEVHGGITYDEKRHGDRIIGFDCAHMGDYVPSIEFRMSKDEKGRELSKKFGDVYKNMEFCLEECKKMVDQLVSLEEGS